MSECEVSGSVVDASRKIETQILKALSTLGQVEIARLMETSESAVSRLKDGQITTFSRLLAAAGLKVVPIQFKCIDPRVASAMMLLYESAMKRLENPVELLWGDE